MHKLRAFLSSFGLSKLFFLLLSAVCLLFVLSFAFGILFPVALTVLLLLFAMVLADIGLLYSTSGGLTIRREIPSLLGLGDEHKVELDLENRFSFEVSLDIYDELPFPFQERDFRIQLKLKPGERKIQKYMIIPKSRGNYLWGDCNSITRSPIGLVKRKIRGAAEESIACFPSILQMKNFELKAFARVANFEGIKRVRRLGHSYEFEQIRSYIQGDEIRTVNWKATSRRHSLMINQYQDEKAQQVYCVLDKSRVMHMPFDGLSLLDYSINTALVLANIALKKHDKAGLISFSDRLGSTIKASRSRSQLKLILNALYNEKTRDTEADFNLLYSAVKNVVKTRSLIFLFTNFESLYSLERALPMLRRLNKTQVLVVVLFINEELENLVYREARDLEDIYNQSIGQKLLSEKRQMTERLHQYGIQSLLTRPKELSLHSVNKYLELKSKGLI